MNTDSDKSSLNLVDKAESPNPERLIQVLGEVESQLNSEDDELIVQTRQVIWKAINYLQQIKLLDIAISSPDDKVRCDAIRQLTQFFDSEKAVDTITKILNDPSTSPEVRETAINARVHIELRAAKAKEKARVEQKIVETVDEKLESFQNLLIGPTLDNYEGYACLFISDASGAALDGSDNKWYADAGQSHFVEIWLQPERPDPDQASNVATESLSIRDGQHSPEVKFNVALASELQFEPRRQTLTVSPGRASAHVKFHFTVPDGTSSNQTGDAQTSIGTTHKLSTMFGSILKNKDSTKDRRFTEQQTDTYDIWCQITQKNRLLQVVRGVLQVGPAKNV